MKRQCPLCKNRSIRLGTLPHNLMIGDQKFTGEVVAEICDTKNCKLSVGVVEAKDLLKFELGAAAICIQLGIVSPASFKFMRKVIGMKAADLGTLFGVTPETVSRWENGDLPIKTRAIALLGCMVMDKIEQHGKMMTIEVLHAFSSPQKQAKVVWDLDGGGKVQNV